MAKSRKKAANRFKRGHPHYSRFQREDGSSNTNPSVWMPRLTQEMFAKVATKLPGGPHRCAGCRRPARRCTTATPYPRSRGRRHNIALSATNNRDKYRNASDKHITKHRHVDVRRRCTRKDKTQPKHKQE